MSDPGSDDRAPTEAEAADRGRAIVAEARAVRRRMLDDAEQRRRALVAELERVRAEIDTAIAALQGAAATAAPDRARESPERAAGSVDALFDVLRAETPPPARKTPHPEPAHRGPAAPGAAEAAAAVEEVGGALHEEAPRQDGDATPAPAAVPERPGDAHRRRRDALVEPLVPEVVRASKRLLQDEQNSLLDSARRSRGRHEPGRLLPEPVRQRETWSALLAPSIDAAYLGGRAASGKTGRVTSAPTRVVVELAALLVTPLRERVTATIESVVAEGPYESTNELQRALGSAIGARYREWRTVDLEDHVADVLAAAYARGAYDAAAPAAMLEWIPAEPGRCPDCDDNALERTLKGKAFPTGQLHPPAHPGCRCLIVPVDA